MRTKPQPFRLSKVKAVVPSQKIAEMAAANACDERLQAKLAELRVTQANKLKLAILNAVAHSEPSSLLGLARQCQSLQPCADMLRRTGLGFLVADQSLWDLGGPEAVQVAAKVTAAWKQAAKGF